MPTVAPKTPRDMLVGSAGAPFLVFNLDSQSVKMMATQVGETYHPAHASISIPYEHRTRFGIFPVL